MFSVSWTSIPIFGVNIKAEARLNFSSVCEWLKFKNNSKQNDKMYLIMDCVDISLILFNLKVETKISTFSVYSFVQ